MSFLDSDWFIQYLSKYWLHSKTRIPNSCVSTTEGVERRIIKSKIDIFNFSRKTEHLREK